MINHEDSGTYHTSISEKGIPTPGVGFFSAKNILFITLYFNIIDIICIIPSYMSTIKELGGQLGDYVKINGARAQIVGLVPEGNGAEAAATYIYPPLGRG